MIELRPLRQFVAVAEELHFSRAAARLHMTQPPLTMAIRQLESVLEVRLFDRNRRSVQLTAAGEALLPLARRLLADAEAVAPQVQAAAAGNAGRLRLAFVSSVGYAHLPSWLRSFRESEPGVALALREATLDVQMEAFAANEIDAGFVLHAPGAAPTGFHQLRVLREPMVLALPSEHVHAVSARLNLDKVLAEPLVVFPRAIAPSLYDGLLSFYNARGLRPRITQEAVQMQTIVNLVSAGIGVAWVPEAVMQLQRSGVVYRRVASAPSCETSLVWPLQPVPVVNRFVDHVKARLAG